MSIFKHALPTVIASALFLSACDDTPKSTKAFTEEVKSMVVNNGYEDALSEDVVKLYKDKLSKDHYTQRYLGIQFAPLKKPLPAILSDSKSVLVDLTSQMKNSYLFCGTSTDSGIVFIDENLAKLNELGKAGKIGCVLINSTKTDKEKVLENFFKSYKSTFDLATEKGLENFPKQGWHYQYLCHNDACLFENEVVFHKSRSAFISLNYDKDFSVSFCKKKSDGFPFQGDSLEDIKAESNCKTYPQKSKQYSLLESIRDSALSKTTDYEQQVEKNKSLDNLIKELEENEELLSELPVLQEATDRLLNLQFEGREFKEITKEHKSDLQFLLNALQSALEKDEYSFIDLCEAITYNSSCKKNNFRKEEIFAKTDDYELDVFLWQDKFLDENGKELNTNVIIFSIDLVHKINGHWKFYFDVSAEPEFMRIFDGIKTLNSTKALEK